MEPTYKAPSLAEALEKFAGRTSAIESGHCIKKPVGCEQPVAGTFRSDLEIQEYRISGLCGDCQRKVFS
jgi:hypothetical protein